MGDTTESELLQVEIDQEDINKLLCLYVKQHMNNNAIEIFNLAINNGSSPEEAVISAIINTMIETALQSAIVDEHGEQFQKPLYVEGDLKNV